MRRVGGVEPASELPSAASALAAAPASCGELAAASDPAPPAERCVPPRRGAARTLRDLARLPNKPIPTPRRRLDELRLLGVIAQRGAQLADRRLQHRLADVLMPPHRVQQIVLGHQHAGVRASVHSTANALGGSNTGAPSRRSRASGSSSSNRSNRMRRLGSGRGHGSGLRLQYSSYTGIFSVTATHRAERIGGIKMRTMFRVVLAASLTAGRVSPAGQGVGPVAEARTAAPGVVLQARPGPDRASSRPARTRSPT